MDETKTRTWKNFRPSVAQAGPGSASGTFIESGAVFEGTLTMKGDFPIDSTQTSWDFDVSDKPWRCQRARNAAKFISRPHTFASCGGSDRFDERFPA